jgi:NADH-quinone oxidoreductase subunit I
MYGKGILQGLLVTLKHFFGTFIDDIRKGKKRYKTDEGVEYRRSKDVEGIFTVQYPEERLPTPENFRFVPFLIYDEKEDGTNELRCTSCGICAKVCPPQCIWIEQTINPKTGRPVPEPVQFFIDIDICMNCGFCADFCPFDSIKMDHYYEMASFDRTKTNILDLTKLSKPASYHAEIHPIHFAREEEIQRIKEEKREERRLAKEKRLNQFKSESNP